ncbi:hypothetical protein C8F04DRAFT_1214830 [Mycena alexandri]|uniref:Uncharacterized protein n=1 Tax=Mycena alexandri TaxID=1745969 RepID=A0AAD6WNJ4_9AGAR|nr:hypothetical protein C8F04DRAFT_1214830 [Mycena alexandri]
MIAFSALVALSALSTALCAPVPRALPTPVSVATAKTYLSKLTVAVASNVPAYARELFKTWDITILKRDGTNVISPYDGVPTTLASDLDIDHLVPLKEREAFASDLTRPQLVAVTDHLNEFKDVTGFVPPLAIYVCTFIRAWITVASTVQH